MISLAQEYFNQNIKKYLKINDYDEIFVSSVSPYGFGGSYKDIDSIDEFVVGYIVQFGRQINGIPIVGSGSSVRVELTPAGKVYGFSFDWPELIPSKTLNSISIEEYIDRRGKLFDPSQNEIVFEQCGIIDLGSNLRSDENIEKLQMACHVGIKSSTDESSNAFVIPLAEVDNVILQTSWPETYLFSDQDIPLNAVSTKDGK